MRNIIVWRRKGSRSGKALVDKLREEYPGRVFSVSEDRIRRIKLRRSTLVVNWGNTLFSLGKSVDVHNNEVIGTNLDYFNNLSNNTVLNDPRYIETSKINIFHILQGLTVPWTVDWDKANSWHQEGEIVFARKYVSASKGKGISVILPEEDVPDSLFYTKYIKAHEYRVHVFKGEVIDITKKVRLSKDHLEERGLTLNPYIKNYDNGWVFKRHDIFIPNGLEEFVLEVYDKLNQKYKFDFAGFDILYNKKNEKFYFLELNARPGLMGTAVDRYTEAIINYVRE